MHAETTLNTIYRPVLIPKEQYAARQGSHSLTNEYSHALILDLFATQYKELIKVRTPRERLSDQQLDDLYTQWISEKNADLEGCWVYYPWSNRLLHILDQDEFIELRTARNRHKITLQEQNKLSQCKIGIIGLSVGHAIAMTLATERAAGSLRLADLDTLELSNLNRIKTGIHNTGLNKSVITAREIAEIDPYLDIECFTEGITTDNLHDFLTRNGKLNLLIDECDDFEIKLRCRDAARPLGIPVVMETSDRGLLDVERFDREPKRSILHGLLDDIPQERLQNISPADRVGLVMRISDVAKVSPRGRASLLEVGQSISTWPQLASAVTLGGGVVADVSRRILLGQFTDSGRYYVDLEQIVSNSSRTHDINVNSNITTNEFDVGRAINAVYSLPEIPVAVYLPKDHIESIVEAGSHAPSFGNTQPWKWIYCNGRLHLFHGNSRSLPFFEFKDIVTHFALGAAFQNVVIKSAELGYHASAQIFPANHAPDLIATIEFSPLAENRDEPSLAPLIPLRATDRTAGMPYKLTDTDLDFLRHAAPGVNARIDFIQEPASINVIAQIVGACDLLAMLHEQGHTDFFENTINWRSGTDEQIENGIELVRVARDPVHAMALSILKDKKIAGILQDIDGGNLLAGQIARTIAASACIAAISVSPDGNPFDAGRIVQNLWLRANKLGLSAEILYSPVILFERMESGDGLNAIEKDKIQRLSTLFKSIIKRPAGSGPVFLLRIHKSSTIATKTNRLALDKILFVVNDEI
ncbi:Rv1355c family protein [Dyadobacter aurulentus]|uniref:Rv1355c family protein n=1 Tax=Dyadobacter sp. UC 10 TaxID=2605428 RepID=UPI0011F2EDF9|nr:Rv1355c family protein [Dyadobacter sp. UC 10]KAA0992009.1 Rv1355c family protein [Dyadobacter sp. UC 10]